MLAPQTYMARVDALHLRRDRSGAIDIGAFAGGLVMIVIAVILLASLLPTIDDAIVDANQSGATGALLGIVTILVVAGLILLLASWMYSMSKASTRR